jgi:hypothetical protein
VEYLIAWVRRGVLISGVLMKRLAILLLLFGLASPALVQAKQYQPKGKKAHYHKPKKFKGGANYSKQHKNYRKPKG